jgi:Tfp pilus assembly protein PilO
MDFDDMTHQQDEHDRRGYDWSQWTAPPTVLAIAIAGATMVGGWFVQQDRMEALSRRVESVERDYQRREVLAEQLRNIDSRLDAIEQKLGDRSPLLKGYPQ